MSYSYVPSTPNTADPLAKFRCSLDPNKINALSSSERDAVHQYDLMIAKWRAELSDIEDAIAISPEGPIKFGLVRQANELRRVVGALFPFVQPYQH